MKITVYTTTTCAYCGMVKKFLDMKNKQYEVVNIDEQTDRSHEPMELSGAFTVPVTVVENDLGKNVVVGYNLAKLAPLVA